MAFFALFRMIPMGVWVVLGIVIVGVIGLWRYGAEIKQAAMVQFEAEQTAAQLKAQQEENTILQKSLTDALNQVRDLNTKVAQTTEDENNLLDEIRTLKVIKKDPKTGQPTTIILQDGPAASVLQHTIETLRAQNDQTIGVKPQ